MALDIEPLLIGYFAVSIENPKKEPWHADLMKPLESEREVGAAVPHFLEGRSRDRRFER
jgi:hypothetical protein